MDMPEFDKMTEEIAEVVERYGLQVDFGCGTLGDNVSITLDIRTPDAFARTVKHPERTRARRNSREHRIHLHRVGGEREEIRRGSRKRVIVSACHTEHDCQEELDQISTFHYTYNAVSPSFIVPRPVFRGFYTPQSTAYSSHPKAYASRLLVTDSRYPPSVRRAGTSV